MVEWISPQLPQDPLPSIPATRDLTSWVPPRGRVAMGCGLDKNLDAPVSLFCVFFLTKDLYVTFIFHCVAKILW